MEPLFTKKASTPVAMRSSAGTTAGKLRPVSSASQLAQGQGGTAAQKRKEEFDPPMFLNDLLKDEDSDDGEVVSPLSTPQISRSSSIPQQYEVKEHEFEAGTTLMIRELAYSTTNAGFVWPATFLLASWILNNGTKYNFAFKRILELGSGTGILSIFLKLQGFDITSSDIPDPEIKDNIAYNCTMNSVEEGSLQHIPHKWGDPFPQDKNKFDVVIASDILLYESQYENLITTLKTLMHNKENKPMFVTAYARKLKRRTFFELLDKHGFSCTSPEPKLWVIMWKE